MQFTNLVHLYKGIQAFQALAVFLPKTYGENGPAPVCNQDLRLAVLYGACDEGSQEHDLLYASGILTNIY